MNILPFLILGGIAAYAYGTAMPTGKARRLATFVFGKPPGGVWVIAAIDPSSVKKVVGIVKSHDMEVKVIRTKPDMHVYAVTGVTDEGPRMIFVVHETLQLAQEAAKRLRAALPDKDVRFESQPFVRKYLTGRTTG